MKKNVLLLLNLFAVVNCFAQQPYCGTDALSKKLMDINPAYKQQCQRADELLHKLAIGDGNSNRQSQTVSSVPVVVHIVHENGPENLSDSVVLAAINNWNLSFQNAAPFFDSTGVNVNIQFCLATVDPYGNPTTGITRTVSPQTDLSLPGTSDLALKNLIRWDPYIYLNLWIIKNTGDPGVAAYAAYPAGAGGGYDGIVCMYSYLTPSVLSHEAGHYFNLYHTFYQGCQNDNCLLDGDKVCDTPPDGTSTFTCPDNSCHTDADDVTSGFNPFTTDVNDAPNYMDYTNCPLAFTQGQSDRMNNALTLFRYVLLQSNGCGQHPGGPIPVASFTTSATCGGTLFTNTSINGVGAQWDFDSDGQIDWSGNSFTYNAPATGYYSVTMYAQGIGGVDTTSQVVFAQHYPYQNYPLVNGFSGLVLLPGGQLTACEGSTIIFQGEPGMAHYYWSNGDTTQNTTFIQGTTPFTISLTTIDSAGLSWTTCYPIPVAAAPAPIPPTITVDPNDTVFCIGSPITLLFTYSPIWLTSTFNSITPFHNSVYTTTLSLFNYFYMTQTDTNGCTSASNSINITALSPTYPANIIQLGNNLLYAPGGIYFQWYLNNAPIANSDTAIFEMTQVGCYKVFYWWSGAFDCGSFSSDSVCITSVGLETVHQQHLDIFPNPAGSIITIKDNGIPGDVYRINLSTPLGQLLYENEFKLQGNVLNEQIDLKKYANGIYFLSVTSGKYKEVFKIKKQ